MPCCEFWPWFPHNFSSLFLKLFSNFQNLLLRYFRDNLPLLYFFTFILLLKFLLWRQVLVAWNNPWWIHYSIRLSLRAINLYEILMNMHDLSLISLRHSAFNGLEKVISENIFGFYVIEENTRKLWTFTSWIFSC